MIIEKCAIHSNFESTRVNLIWLIEMPCSAFFFLCTYTDRTEKCLEIENQRETLLLIHYKNICLSYPCTSTGFNYRGLDMKLDSVRANVHWSLGPIRKQFTRYNIIARGGVLSPGCWTAFLYVPINRSLCIKPVIVFKYYAIRSISYSEMIISSHYTQ